MNRNYCYILVTYDCQTYRGVIRFRIMPRSVPTKPRQRRPGKPRSRGSARLPRHQRRQQLAEVSRRAFAVLGYEAASLEEIADRAGVYRSILCSHFRKMGLAPSPAPIYANVLIGIGAHVGRWWRDHPEITLDQVTTHATDMICSGRGGLIAPGI